MKNQVRTKHNFFVVQVGNLNFSKRNKIFHYKQVGMLTNCKRNSSASFKQNILSSKRESIFLRKVKVGLIIIAYCLNLCRVLRLLDGKAFKLSPKF